MEVKQDIPATIHVRNFQARVFYEGLQNKCFVCGSTEHLKANCPKRSNISQRLVQDNSPENPTESRPGTSSSSGSGPPLFSDMAAGRWSGRPTPKPKDTVSNGMVVLNSSSTSAQRDNAKADGVPTAIVMDANVSVEVNCETEESRDEGNKTAEQDTGTPIVVMDEVISSESEAMEEDNEGAFQIVKDRKRVRRSREAESSSDGSTGSGTVKVINGKANCSIGETQSIITRSRSKLMVLNNDGGKSDGKNIDTNSKDN